jgi:hypothetical protein
VYLAPTAAAIAVHTARNISSTKTAVNSRPEDADDSNRAGAQMIEYLVDRLADHMRFAAASLAGGAIPPLVQRILLSRIMIRPPKRLVATYS